MAANRGRPKRFYGIVRSCKADKTVVVEVRQRMQHPLLKKVVWKRKKVHAHDQKNACKAGDRVELLPCRPMSRTKRFRVSRVVEGSS